MRINKYVASATGLSRRAADAAIQERRATINGRIAKPGDDVKPTDKVALDNQLLVPSKNTVTIMLNKPVGYVCSRQGQGSRTVYDLLPAKYHKLKPVGRLDKDSSGLLLLTNDGELANRLTHPRFAKVKIYEIKLDHPLEPLHQQMVNDHGIQLADGPSRLILEPLDDDRFKWQVTMSEGRNRQIRRTFSALGYTTVSLHRMRLGPYDLGQLGSGKFRLVAG